MILEKGTVTSIENIIDRAIDYSRSKGGGATTARTQLTSESESDKGLHSREYTKLENLTNEIDNTIKGITNLKINHI